MPGVTSDKLKAPSASVTAVPTKAPVMLTVAPPRGPPVSRSDTNPEMAPVTGGVAYIFTVPRETAFTVGALKEALDDE